MVSQKNVFFDANKFAILHLSLFSTSKTFTWGSFEQSFNEFGQVVSKKKGQMQKFTDGQTAVVVCCFSIIFNSGTA